jgi:hypothetical protein
MARLSSERVQRLREEAPDVYDAYLELADISAQAHNTIVAYGDSKRFRGKLMGLALTLERRQKAEDEAEGEERDFKTGLESAVEKLRHDGWANCHTGG